MERAMRALCLLLLSLAATTAACTSPNTNGGVIPPYACQAGQTVTCVCTDRASGIQECSADGGAYSECNCGADAGGVDSGATSPDGASCQVDDTMCAMAGDGGDFGACETCCESQCAAGSSDYFDDIQACLCDGGPCTTACSGPGDYCTSAGSVTSSACTTCVDMYGASGAMCDPSFGTIAAACTARPACASFYACLVGCP